MIGRNLQIELDDAVPGMTLSDAVVDNQGGVLLPGGTTLTETMLSSLRRRGIDYLSIVNDKLSDADLAAERERLQQRLVQLFRKCNNQGAGNLLLQSVTQYRLGDNV